MSTMISPPVLPARSRPRRHASGMLPQNLRLASLIGAALVLLSVVIATLLAAHMETRALVYPQPTIDIINLTEASPVRIAVTTVGVASYSVSCTSRPSFW